MRVQPVQCTIRVRYGNMGLSLSNQLTMTALLHSLLHALSPSDEAAEKKESRFKQFFVRFMTVKSKQQRKNVIAELGRHSLQNQKV